MASPFHVVRPAPKTSAERAREAGAQARALTASATNDAMDLITDMVSAVREAADLPEQHPGIREALRRIADRAEADAKTVQVLIGRLG